jgi:type II secretory pathway component PulF
MVIFMMIFIVPRITESFTKAGAELPALTQFVVDVSDFFRNDYMLLVGYIIGFIFIVKAINSTYF